MSLTEETTGSGAKCSASINLATRTPMMTYASPMPCTTRLIWRVALTRAAGRSATRESIVTWHCSSSAARIWQLDAVRGLAEIAVMDKNQLGMLDGDDVAH
ncbi:hypothetical protein [Bradyrhizobium sp. CCBAU 21360]|uniref:hypothetical protein n=1 Tax=Bradyrhizobium sp. CCBAU 21360 TaxID=1325081 RepID=UPI002305D8B3|nr:hypothetical protein [Bradyrhizobium sp. CCBAU 21360]